MKNVVITGSTRGIGLALARDFLQRGHNVVVSGRSASASSKVSDELNRSGAEGRAIGIACDVQELVQLQALWDGAVSQLGSVDIWINNAGQAHGTHRFWEQPTDRIVGVIGTNLTGLMLACHVAINGMRDESAVAEPIEALKALGADVVYCQGDIGSGSVSG